MISLSIYENLNIWNNFRRHVWDHLLIDNWNISVDDVKHAIDVDLKQYNAVWPFHSEDDRAYHGERFPFINFENEKDMIWFVLRWS